MRARAFTRTFGVSLSAIAVLALVGCGEGSSPTSVGSLDAKGGVPGNTTPSTGAYSVLVTLPAAKLVAGDSSAAAVTITDSKGNLVTGKTVSWTSQSPAVAVVGSNGMMKALAAGVAVIQATVGGSTGSATLVVEPAPVIATLVVATDSTSMAPGHSCRALAMAKDASGNVINGKTPTWTSLTPSIASVSETGVVTAISAGTAKIQGSISGVTETTSLTVTAPIVVSVATSASVTLNSPALTVGQTTQANAVVKDAQGAVMTGVAVSWFSSAPAVATVSSSGLVTAVGAGTATIAASTSNGVAASASLTVTAVSNVATTVSSVVITMDSASLAPGTTTRAVATARNSSGTVLTGLTTTWTSLTPAIAAVSSTGVVTALAAGTAQIQGTVSGVAGAAALTVRQPVVVAVPTTVTVTLNSPNLTTGQSTQANAVVKDAQGNIMTGATVSWSSAATAIATVSASGLVVAVAPGSASIRATVGNVTGLATVNVTAPSTVASTTMLAFNDFSSGSIAPFTNPWATTEKIDVIDDPTGGNHGKIAKLHYAPTLGGSHEVGLTYTSPTGLRYGKTIWMTADVFIKSGYANQKMEDSRKLVDWQGNGCRIVFTRVDALRRLTFDTYHFVNGQFTKITEWTTASVPDDQWTKIEVRMTTNSADNVQDGVIEIYLNGADTPAYRRTGLSWITESPVGEYKTGSSFNFFNTGYQLTSNGSTAYEEDRFWDNIGFATTRIVR